MTLSRDTCAGLAAASLAAWMSACDTNGAARSDDTTSRTVEAAAPKHLLVVTDGDNTNGRPPDEVAREIFQKSEGAMQVYFVAFDTSPQKFAFLKDVGGDVIGAGTGAELRQAPRWHLSRQDPRRSAWRRGTRTGQAMRSLHRQKETL
jgi:hypothetical protein